MLAGLWRTVAVVGEFLVDYGRFGRGFGGFCWAAAGCGVFQYLL